MTGSKTVGPFTGGDGVVGFTLADDLEPFGIKASDLGACEASDIDLKIAGLPEGFDGYKIPYTDMFGLPAAHFRMRQLPLAADDEDHGAFIRSSPDTAYVYFPPRFRALADSPTASYVTLAAHELLAAVEQTHRVLFVVEDERLAAAIVKRFKYMAVAIQGPAGWKAANGPAKGLSDLVARVREEGWQIILWIGDTKAKNVQAEVSQFGMQLKYMGVPFKQLRQYTYGSGDLTLERIKRTLRPLSKFPKHPNIREYILEKMAELDIGRFNRQEQQEIGLAILSDLEARGTRIRSLTTGDCYYFDRGTKELTRASLESANKDMIQNTDFMARLYQDYGLARADYQIMSWFSTQFAAEDPIVRTKSYTTLMCEPRTSSTVAIQITPSEFAYIDYEKSPKATIRSNGDFNILFEKPPQNNEAIDIKELEKWLEKERQKPTLDMWWGDVTKEIRVKKNARFLQILALMFYVSPWLKGWRDIQLPIEVSTGEAGLGKSSLFQLRMQILTGNPKLQSLPDSMKEFHARIANVSGLCVFDNVHLENKSRRQQFSDEMCRLVTEPRPTISLRQLYKTAEIAEFPFNATFGITSIDNVFTKIDFIQRAIILQYERFGDIVEDARFGTWVSDKLGKYGGRTAWLAHHLVALERFFAIVEREWDSVVSI